MINYPEDSFYWIELNVLSQDHTKLLLFILTRFIK